MTKNPQTSSEEMRPKHDVAAAQSAALSGAATVQEPKTVLAAMSGGVDSSVIAALLVEAGYEVTGVTMKLFGGACCSPKDAADARGVCDTLGITHYVFDFSQDFGHQVIDRFCDSYLRGETPNPCIDCNRYIKFDALQQRRAQMGFDYMATGHYVRREYDQASGKFVMKTALDAGKDQSYVLYNLTQDSLAHSLFPLGGFCKDQVRVLAAEHGFANADKPESQDICFVPDGDYRKFIHERTGRDFTPGDIVNEAGVKLGEHPGLANFTIGQRKGLGVAAGHPLFVLAKNLDTNELVVGPAESQGVSRLWADEVNLIHLEDMRQPEKVQAKVNYRARAVEATAWIDDAGMLQVVFDEPVRACAQGQACVLYQGDLVLGGGVISGFAK